VELVRTEPIPVPPYYVKGLALGIPAILLGLQISGWLFFIPVITHGHNDFRQLYTGGYMLRLGYGHQLYDYDAQKAFEDKLVSPEEIALPINHLAYEELLFVPLSLLNFRAAYLAFLGINIALLGISFRLLLPWMDNLAAVSRSLPAAMFLVFIPVAVALMQGQDSVLLLALLAAAAVSLDRGRELAAGIFVGLGLFKFQLVIPIALLFLVWRRWRFSAGFALSSIAAGLVSLWLVGFSQIQVYIHSLLSMSVTLHSQVDQYKYGIVPTSMPNLRGLIYGLGHSDLSPSWLQAITVASSAFVLLLVAILIPRNRPAFDALLLAITTSTVVSYHIFSHDWSILLLPLAVTLNRFINTNASGRKDVRLALLASVLLFVAPVCISFMPHHLYLASLPLLAFLYAIIAASRNGQIQTQVGDPVPDFAGV
jgi:Glycosyltransferase family 87